MKSIFIQKNSLEASQNLFFGLAPPGGVLSPQTFLILHPLPKTPKQKRGLATWENKKKKNAYLKKKDFFLGKKNPLKKARKKKQRIGPNARFFFKKENKPFKT